MSCSLAIFLKILPYLLVLLLQLFRKWYLVQTIFFGEILGFSDDKCMLSKSMEDKIVNDWASWNFLEKGIVCEALNKCNVVSEGGINDSLWNLLKQDFLNMSDDIVCDPYISPVIPFSSLLQTHRKFDQYEIQQIFCKFGPNLKHMRPDARIRLLTVIKANTNRYICKIT